MIKELTSRRNLNAAYLKVFRNRGAAGVDGIGVTQLHDKLQTEGADYIYQIENGSYQTQPILGVEIPKGNGSIRLLGIPTVVDRLFQQALHQILQPKFESDFQDQSYGFRPNRNAQQAVTKSLEIINSGYQNIVDIDLQSFFDEVEHYVLLQLIYKKVKCNKTLKLLRSFLRAPILIKGKLRKRKKGVPQGSPLSPLLSNILLNELDKELIKRGHHFVRYADDFSIYVKSKKAAKRVGNSIYLFLKKKKPYSIRHKTRAGLCMESYKNGRLASCSKSHSRNDNYHQTIESTRLYFFIGLLSESSIELTNRRYGGVRGVLRPRNLGRSRLLDCAFVLLFHL